MPYFSFKEIWTPLKFVGIRIFSDETGKLWIKPFNRHKRRLFKRAA